MSKKKTVFYFPVNTKPYYSKCVSKYLTRLPIPAAATEIQRYHLERAATLLYTLYSLSSLASQYLAICVKINIPIGL